MLKVGMGGRPPLVESPLEEEAPEEALPLEEEPMMEEEMPEEQPLPEEEVGPHKLDPMKVVYMTPDMGPFMCGNCCYYQNPGQCHLVEGEIDSEGCCNLFCPPEHGEEEVPLEDEAMMEGESIPFEMAEEEAGDEDDFQS